MFDLLSHKVLEITRLRLLGIERKEIFLYNPELKLNSNESVLNYSSQNNEYYFDYGISVRSDDVRGIEGSISPTAFKMTEYPSNLHSSNTFKMNIADIPSEIGEDEFFQYSLIENVSEMTIEQLRDILVIRDILKNLEIQWDIK